MNQSYIFDSYALLELLEDGPGAGIVADILTISDNRVWVSNISLGEIYYILLRRRSYKEAEAVIDTILLGETIEMAEADWPRIKQAAVIKAGGSLSYADLFVIALGLEKKATVVTGDPEIIEKAGKLEVDVLAI